MLRDVVSGSGLNLYAIIALVLFFGAFLAVVIWVWRRPASQIDRQSRLPLDDGPEPMEPRDPGAKHVEGARHG